MDYYFACDCGRCLGLLQRWFFQRKQTKHHQYNQAGKNIKEILWCRQPKQTGNQRSSWTILTKEKTDYIGLFSTIPKFPCFPIFQRLSYKVCSEPARPVEKRLFHHLHKSLFYYVSIIQINCAQCLWCFFICVSNCIRK